MATMPMPTAMQGRWSLKRRLGDTTLGSSLTDRSKSDHETTCQANERDSGIRVMWIHVTNCDGAAKRRHLRPPRTWKDRDDINVERGRK